MAVSLVKTLHHVHKKEKIGERGKDRLHGLLERQKRERGGKKGEKASRPRTMITMGGGGGKGRGNEPFL